MTEEEKIKLFENVLSEWGVENQVFMVMEETGEMLNALAKANRGRVTKEEIITELADVSILMEQMAVFFGYEAYKAEKERKLIRLSERLERDIERRTTEI